MTLDGGQSSAASSPGVFLGLGSSFGVFVRGPRSQDRTRRLVLERARRAAPARTISARAVDHQAANRYGPTQAEAATRVGYSAETGERVPVRGMLGRERRNGLTVEKLAFGRYAVLQVADGNVKRRALLSVPSVDAWDDQPFDPVIVGDQVGWFQRTNTEAGWGWFFSPLGGKGLTPHLVGGEYPLKCGRCDTGHDPVLELGGVCCSYYAFFRNGSWSDPVQTRGSIAGAGPRLWTLTCRENLATQVLGEYGLNKPDEFIVELNRCTARECRASTVTWKAPRPTGLILAAHLIDNAGSEKVAIAWHDARGAFAWKLAPFEALAGTETHVVRLPHRIVPDNGYPSEDHLLVHGGVALLVFGQQDKLRILRIDVEGNVGTVDVDTIHSEGA